MVDWLEPLELETIFSTLFAGDPQIFIAIALISISAMAGYFRNNTLTFIYMIGLFLLMFTGNGLIPIVVFFSILGAFAVGFIVSKLVGER